MELICEKTDCTGCGMCANICHQKAIEMVEKEHGFVFPKVNNDLCNECGLCKKKCPANSEKRNDSTVKGVFASWSINKKVRNQSTSGGIFSLLAEEILKDEGLVIGVAWDDKYHATHVAIEKPDELYKLRGSKYSQSDTAMIYQKIKSYLIDGRKILFSGTPCQNAALKSYLGKEYDNLFQVDLVCHGVPSARFLDEYLGSFKKSIKNVRLRYKDPYWDYTFVRVDFSDGTHYQARTIDDPYFNLFNIGYSIRESCHRCKYTSLHRESDITLADFWGYRAHDFKSRNYNYGTSLVLLNSEKGKRLFKTIGNYVYYEEANIDLAIKGNKCLKEPFIVEEREKSRFWDDYENGVSIRELDKKYTEHSFVLPKHLTLRRLINKYRWILKR